MAAIAVIPWLRCHSSGDVELDVSGGNTKEVSCSALALPRSSQQHEGNIKCRHVKPHPLAQSFVGRQQIQQVKNPGTEVAPSSDSRSTMGSEKIRTSALEPL